MKVTTVKVPKACSSRHEDFGFVFLESRGLSDPGDDNEELCSSG